MKRRVRRDETKILQYFSQGWAQLRKNFLETWFCCQKALIMPRTNVYLVPKISAIMLQSAKYCRQQSYLLRSFVTRALLQTRQAPVWAPGW